MGDYTKLIKSLKICTNGSDNCYGCKNYPSHFGCYKDLAGEAADVIEGLSKLADAIPHVCECCIGCELEKKNGGCDNALVLSPKRAMQYLIKPRWIPVTERLPEPNAVDKYGFAKGYLVKTDRHVMMHTARYTGEWWVLWGYHEVITDNVTHWMPLPEPPKEVRNCDS